MQMHAGGVLRHAIFTYAPECQSDTETQRQKDTRTLIVAQKKGPAGVMTGATSAAAGAAAWGAGVASSSTGRACSVPAASGVASFKIQTRSLVTLVH